MKDWLAMRRSRNGGARTAPKPPPPFRRKLLFEALEPRILLSADLNPAHEALLDAAAAPLVRVVEAQQPGIAIEAHSEQSRAIVFVDPTVANYRQLVDA